MSVDVSERDSYRNLPVQGLMYHAGASSNKQCRLEWIPRMQRRRSHLRSLNGPTWLRFQAAVLAALGALEPRSGVELRPGPQDPGDL